MCGICGILRSSCYEKIDLSTIDRMTDLMTHRGPDGRGVWLDGEMALGHRRLAIIDPEGSPQPMRSHSGRYVISYNGELYNYRQIRRELESKGCTFQTNGDTEVVLEAFAMWGKDAFVRFNGMFAISIWDSDERRLTLARDRLGIKPLLYSAKGNCFSFASEFPALISLPWVSKDIDPLGITAYLGYYQLTFDRHTVFSDIKSLEPGNFLQVDSDGHLHHSRYWQLPIIPTNEKREMWSKSKTRDLAKQLEHQMRQSVDRHMIADVEVGSFLSGGLDSSIVVTLMSDIARDRVQAYSIGFDEADYNEFEFAIPLIKKLGLQHELISFDMKNYLDFMRQLIRHKRAPLTTPNEVPIYALSMRLAEDIKVVLSGEGADELLGGYGPMMRSPHDYIMSQRISNKAGNLNSVGRDAILGALNNQYGRTSFADITDHFLTVYSWVGLADRRDILNRDFFAMDVEEELRGIWRLKFDRYSKMTPYDQYMHIFETEHLKGLLGRLDANTMAASVEGRVPFCDNDLVEFVNSLPFSFKLHWKSPKHKQAATGLNSLQIAENLDVAKYLLKEAFKNRIPDPIINRKKKAFPVPLDSWFKTEEISNLLSDIGSWKSLEPYLNVNILERWMRASLESSKMSMQVWMVLNLAIWIEEMENY